MVRTHPMRSRGLAKLAAGAAAAALLTAAVQPAQGNETLTSLSHGRVMITQFQGKPPFKRRVTSRAALSAAEIARLEPVAEVAVDESRIGERVRAVDFRGKPPYPRRFVEIDAANAVELARLEPVTTEQSAPFAPPRFPGKHLPGRRAR